MSHKFRLIIFHVTFLYLDPSYSNSCLHSHRDRIQQLPLRLILPTVSTVKLAKLHFFYASIQG